MISHHQQIAFERIGRTALAYADVLVPRWLPEGKREGAEWVAINPTRADHRKGSFKVNLRTGRWGDFATDDRGNDLIALASYVFDLKQGEAAIKVAQALEIDPYE